MQILLPAHMARERGALLQTDAMVAAFPSVIAQIMALGNVKIGFDPLLDLPLGFGSWNRLPVLCSAEPPISGIQLLRSDLPHWIRDYHVFDE